MKAFPPHSHSLLCLLSLVCVFLPTQGQAAREKEFVDGLVKMGFLDLAIEVSAKMMQDPNVEKPQALMAMAGLKEKQAAAEADPASADKKRLLDEAAGYYQKILDDFSDSPCMPDAQFGRANIQHLQATNLYLQTTKRDPPKDKQQIDALKDRAARLFGKAVVSLIRSIRNWEKEMDSVKERAKNAKTIRKEKTLARETQQLEFRIFKAKMILGWSHFYQALCSKTNALKMLEKSQKIFYEDLGYKYENSVAGGYAYLGAGRTYAEIYKRIKAVGKKGSGGLTVEQTKEKALECFRIVGEKAVDPRARDLCIDACRYHVDFCMEIKMFDQAIDAVDGLLVNVSDIDRDPRGLLILFKQAEALFERAKIFKADGAMEKGLKDLQRARQVAIRIQRRGIRDANALLVRMEQEWGEILATNPETALARGQELRTQGAQLLQDKQDEAAMTKFTQSLAAFHDCLNAPTVSQKPGTAVEAFWNMARTYMDLGRHREASIAFAYLADHYPDSKRHCDAAKWSAMTLLVRTPQGYSEGVLDGELYVEALRNIAARHTDCEIARDVAYHMADYLFDDKQFAEAARQFALVSRDSRYYETARRMEAVSWYLAYYQLDRSGKGEEQESRGLLEKARTMYESYLQWAETLPLSTAEINTRRHNNLAQGKLSLAAIYMDESMNAYAQTLQLLEGYEEKYPEMVKDQTKTAKLLFYRVRAYVGLQQYDAAIAAFDAMESAYAGNQLTDSAGQILANALLAASGGLKNSDAAKAKQYRHTALDILGRHGGDIEDIEMFRADSLYKQEDYAEAAEVYKRILEDMTEAQKKAPGRLEGLSTLDEVHYKLAVSYYHAAKKEGDAARAKPYWEKAKEAYHREYMPDHSVAKVFEGDFAVMKERMDVYWNLQDYSHVRDILLDIRGNPPSEKDGWWAKMQLIETYLTEENYQRALQLIAGEIVYHAGQLGEYTEAYIKYLEIVERNLTGELKEKARRQIEKLRQPAMAQGEKAT